MLELVTEAVKMNTISEKELRFEFPLVQQLENERLEQYKDKHNSYHGRETKEKGFQEGSNGWCQMPPREQGACAWKRGATGFVALRPSLRKAAGEW